MRVSAVSCITVFAAAVTGLEVTQPGRGQCVDLTEPLTVQWIPSSDDRPTISFSLWNFSGANPPINESIPISGSEPTVVSTSLGSYDLPAISTEEATRFHNINNGNGYQIEVVPIGGSNNFYSDPFIVATPGGC